MVRVRILPKQPKLAETPTRRRHEPTPAPESARGYEVYRCCLRWDFGFTCAFCLLHEVQVAPEGARGSGRFWLEHLELKHERPELVNHYDNVVYACRRCNLARGTTPRHAGDGSRLLDPCSDAWAGHFVMEGDALRGITGDGIYTEETYDVNSPPKVEMRAEHREALEEALALLRDGPGMMDELTADLSSLPLARQTKRLQIIKKLHRDLRRAHRVLQRLHAIPADRDEQCRCKSTAHHSLPDWLLAQTMDLPLD